MTDQRDELDFGPWLRQRRRTLDLTQQQLAEQAICSVATIKKLEAGDLVPSKHLAGLLATVLGVPIAEHEAFVRFARTAEAHLPAHAFSSSPVTAIAPSTTPAPPAYSNLPTYLTSVIGREREVALLCALLKRPAVRLLTLTGPPGIGKTRLSLEVATQLQTSFADHVCFVPLAPVSDPTLVTAAIARALGVREQSGEALLHTLQTLLHTKALLLVLDNFEQVVAGAGVVKALLEAAPNVKALVTSREVLHVYGEQTFPVPLLNMPDPKRLPSPDALLLYPAVELFVERAQAQVFDWEVNAENALAVVEICTWLDGLPLAIEMAAAQIKWASPHTLLAQLRQRLTALNAGPRDLTPRQQTLRGAIDWSYDLLDPALCQLFNRLSIFVGGATVTAITTVCGEAVGTHIEMYLHQLVDKSLLRYQRGDGDEERYWLLETMREYAAEKLQASGEAAVIATRHQQYFYDLVAQAVPGLMGGQQAMWLARLERDHDNLRAALTWAFTMVDDAEVAVAFTDMLFHFWNGRSHFQEGRHWLEAAAAKTSAPTALRARVLNRAGTFAWQQGDLLRASALQTAALAIQEVIGDPIEISRSLQNMAIVAGINHEYVRARSLLERSLKIEREHANVSGLVVVLHNLAIVAQRENDSEQATMLLTESLALKRQMGNEIGSAPTLRLLGKLQQQRGNHHAAMPFLRESLLLGQRLNDPLTIAAALECFGLAASAQDQHTLAAHLWSVAARLRAEMNSAVGKDQREEHAQALATLRVELGAPAFAAAWELGQTTSIADAVQAAVRLEA